MLFQNVAQLLASSRFVWALARESAIPCSGFFKKVTVKHKLPSRAIWAVIGITAPALVLLAISSRVVGTILLEGTAWATIASYIIPIGLYLTCPPDALVGDGRNEWTLRGWSQPLAKGVLFIGIIVLVVLCLPTGYPIGPRTSSSLF